MKSVKRAITTEDLTKLNVYSDPQVTPNGQAYIYVSTYVNDKNDYNSHLFFQKIDGSKPKQWTYNQSKDSHPRFSPNGDKLIFQSTRSGLPQIWQLNTNGGEAEQITTFKNGATNPHWSKDGSKIIFTALLDKDDDVTKQTEQSKEERQAEQKEKSEQPLVINRLKYKSDSLGFHDMKRAQIIVYDIENDSYTQLTTADTHHRFEDISPSNDLILFSANLNDDEDYEITNDLFTLNIHSKEITKLTDGNGSYGNAQFSPNGEKVACFGHGHEYKGATLSELFIIDLNRKERVCLSKEWDIQLGDLMIGDTRLGESTTGPVWSKDEESLFFIGTEFGATALYEVNLQSKLSTLYKDNNHVFGFSYDKHTDSFILGISTPTNPGDFYLWERDKELKPLTKGNEKLLEEISLSEPEEVTVTAEDGWEIQGWIMKPYGFQDGKKYPFVLEVHGGPHAMYGQTFFHEMQLLAAKGYVVLYTNPRGSHGYGQEFVDAVRADYGGKDYTDLMSAVDYALENYSFIDEKRLGVTGGSYGGFMTNWIVGHTNRFKAAVTQRSISNWLSFYGVSDIGYFFTKWELGENLLDDPEKLWDFSPLKYADKVETPLLILHGEQDLRCPVEQGEQLFIALKHLRKDVEFVRFPGANHELSRSGKPNMRIARLNHICRWFEKYL